MTSAQDAGIHGGPNSCACCTCSCACSCLVFGGVCLYVHTMLMCMLMLTFMAHSYRAEMATSVSFAAQAVAAAAGCRAPPLAAVLASGFARHVRPHGCMHHRLGSAFPSAPEREPEGVVTGGRPPLLLIARIVPILPLTVICRPVGMKKRDLPRMKEGIFNPGEELFGPRLLEAAPFEEVSGLLAPWLDKHVDTARARRGGGEGPPGP